MAEWDAVKIDDIVQDINNHKIVLPVIQRNLVWDEEKMELLFDTLLKGNSFGGIMALEEEKGSQPLFAFRQFSIEGELHDSDFPPVLDHQITLIIDGQQRLQTFYMGLRGGVNGKRLYFNLFSQEDYEFEFAGQLTDLPASRREDGVEISTQWYPVNTLYTQLKRVGGDDRRAAKEIIESRSLQDELQKELIYKNVRRFERTIFGMKTLGISKVYIDHSDPDGERRRMVELFRRLNDGGTRLSALDLAASMLKGFDHRLEGFLRREIPRFSDIGFGQDEVIKLVFLLQNNYVKEVTDISKDDANFAIQYSERILKTLEVLRQFLIDAELYEYYRYGGRSVIPLQFIAYHIFHKSEPIENLSNVYVNYDANNPDFTNIKRWIYLSLLNGVFSRGRGWVPYLTGTRKILGVISQYKGKLFPADELFSLYESHPLVFSRELSESRFQFWDMSFAFYLMYGRRNLTGRDIDHIQPKSTLEQAGTAPHKIHSLSNYQLLDEGTNRGEKRAKTLENWLKGFEANELNPYLERHLIPQNPKLRLLESFDDFLTERSQLIVGKIQQAIPHQSVPSTKAEPTPDLKKEPRKQVEGAAQLTRAERDPEAWLNSVADQEGFGTEFRLMVAAARSAGLYARFQNNWWIVMLTQPRKRNRGLVDLSTSLNIWVNFPGIAEYLNCPVEEVKEKLDFGKQIRREDVLR